jgi:hypothetical protein
MRRTSFVKLSFLVLSIVLSASFAQAQSVFTYQGKLNDGGVPANGTYDLTFKLFSLTSGGTQIGSDVVRDDVTVTNGVFTVNLDFGSSPFTSATANYLEILVRPGASSGAYTLLAPRLPITNSPYSIKSANADNAVNATTATTATNALNLGGVAANQFVQTTDSRLSDARNPLPNSANYIQNNFGVNQQNASFNIAGTGNADSFNVVTAYKIGGFPVLVADLNNDNTLVGLSIRQGGMRNSFLGAAAGRANTANDNSFFGFAAGNSNNSGTLNSFFGTGAGNSNTSGSENSFFGYAAGSANQTACCNSFFGRSAGQFNTTGQLNTFIGGSAGENNVSGGNNTFIGGNAGENNTLGFNNTVVGYQADFSVNNLTNATAIGYRAFVSQSNSLVLGSISGVNNGSDTKVGIGTTAPVFKLQVIDSSNTGLRVQTNATGGTVASFGGNGRFEIDSSGFSGGRFKVEEDGTVTIGRDGVGGNLTVYGNTLLNTVTIANSTKINVLGVGGSTSLCRNATAEISSCSSSLRYKTNIASFSSGLSLIKRLSPITFDWKQGGMKDLGLGAEDVEKIEPLLVTYNEKGEVEGIKYDRVGVVLINAVKEQQAQIESQQKLINEQTDLIKQQTEKLEGQQSELEKQKSELEALKKLVCSDNPTAEICQPKK